MPRDPLFPGQPPFGSSRRCRVKLDRAAIRHDRSDILAADEAERPVVEIVAAEIVDHRPVRAGRDKGIYIGALVHEDSWTTGRLIAVVAPDNAFAALRIIGFANA